MVVTEERKRRSLLNQTGRRNLNTMSLVIYLKRSKKESNRRTFRRWKESVIWINYNVSMIYNTKNKNMMTTYTTM